MEQKVLKPSERIGEIRDKIIQDMVSAYKKKVAAEAASLETDNPSILGCKTFFSPASCRSNSLFNMDTCIKTVEFCEKPEVWIQAILDYLDDLPIKTLDVSDPQSTTADPSPPQPSQGSPATSEEL